MRCVVLVQCAVVICGLCELHFYTATRRTAHGRALAPGRFKFRSYARMVGGRGTGGAPGLSPSLNRQSITKDHTQRKT